ncbi:FliH/SctL family protein [Novosphingobium sp. ZN18A2]|uniref:FliH/SctL family protein n=1 Tax=Novosphingobium sp. ZN18A2 TaxID=3079861 RepID=UPI0030D2F625
MQHEVQHDPLAEAFERGRDEGEQQALTACAAERRESEAARQRIVIALARLDEAQTRTLAERLRDTVLALCDSVLADAAIQPEALAARVDRAARMLTRADDERVIRLHPDDLALVAPDLPDDWVFEPDPALERGAVRIEGTDGGVENGPDQWRRAIEEALRRC